MIVDKTHSFPKNLHVGHSEYGSGTLIIRSGGNLIVGQSATVGDASSGNIEMNGGILKAGHSLTVGYGDLGTGNFKMQSGQVHIHRDFTIGENSGAGSVIIEKGLINAKTLTVGSHGKGIMTLNGSVVNIRENIAVGKFSSEGDLMLTGGTLNVGAMQIGHKDSNGTVDVENGGRLNVDGPLVIGDHSKATGMGNLTVSSGMVSPESVHLSRGKVLLNTGGVLSTHSLTTHQLNDELIFNGGTVQAKSNHGDFFSGFSRGQVHLTSQGGTIDTNGFSIVIPTEISGPGSLTIRGSGILTLTGNNTYFGNTIIQTGELCVNGRLASPNVLIQSGGGLSGIGILGGNVWNSGWISPANSIGTLTILGNYTQTNQGTYLAQIADSSSDLLAVGGSDQLDGTLDIQLVSMPSSEGYLILTANEVKGTFSKVSTPADFLVEVLYDPKEVWLLILGIGKRMIVLEKFTPQIAAHIKDVLLNVTNTLYGQLTTRLAAIRSGLKGFALQGLSEEKAQYSKTAHSSSKQILQSATQEPLWDLWTSASGVFSKINNVRDLPSTNSITGLFSVGTDYNINKIFDVGAYLAYQSTWARYSQGSLRGNGLKYGLYATTQWEGFYLNAIVAGSTHSFNIKHSFDFAHHSWTTSGNPLAQELDILLGSGYEHHLGSWIFGLNNSIQYTHLTISAFTQSTTRTRNLNVRVGSQYPSSLIYTLGANISYLFQISPNSQILPTLGLYWQHEFLNFAQTIESRLANNKGVPFYFQSQSGARNNAFGVAGITAQIDSRYSLFAYYTPQFGGKQIYSNAFLIGLNFNF